MIFLPVWVCEFFQSTLIDSAFRLGSSMYFSCFRINSASIGLMCFDVKYFPSALISSFSSSTFQLDSYLAFQGRFERNITGLFSSGQVFVEIISKVGVSKTDLIPWPGLDLIFISDILSNEYWLQEPQWSSFANFTILFIFRFHLLEKLVFLPFRLPYLIVNYCH